MVLLLAALALVAPQPSSVSCGDLPEVIQSARVVELNDPPSGLDLRFEVPGLTIREQSAVDWPTCPVHLQDRVLAGWAFTDTGVPIRPSHSRLITRTDRMYPPGVEPDHPDVTGAAFVGSVNLVSGNRRIGLWRSRDGTSIVGVYRPDQSKPLRLLQSGKPILGIGYFPAPDAAGGTLSFWQLVGKGRYRFVAVAWDEKPFSGGSPAAHGVPRFIPHHAMPPRKSAPTGSTSGARLK